MEDERGNSYLNLDLINVMYGVVAGYGIFAIDNATAIGNYINFIFAFIVIIMDWLYLHSTYKSINYKRSYLVLDLITIFFFSRLFSSSTVGDPLFYFWLSLIFVVYFIWDYLMHRDKIPSTFDWLSCIKSDIAGAIIFFVLWVVFENNLFLQENILLKFAGVVVYAVIVSAWFKKPKLAQT